MSLISDTIKFANETTPNFKILTIDGKAFTDAGSSAVQELAYTFSKAIEYIEQLKNHGLEPETTAQHIGFIFGIGSNYFMEIAKLRAARILWTSILKLYNVTSETHITSIPTSSNKSIYDVNVNMLRLTTEAMSASIGGADTVNVSNFDDLVNGQDEFSDRISRNIQLILKGESYLDQSIDPSQGSYYIETLTNKLVDSSLELFQKIESDGGFMDNIKNGNIQTSISNIVEQKETNINTRKDIILGTNQYPNSLDTFIQAKESNTVDVDQTKCFDTYEQLRSYYGSNYSRFNYDEREIENVIKLRPYSAAKDFNDLRRTVETSKNTPKVFLLTYGHLAMRKARAVFSLNFFGCAGFEVIDNPGFETVKSGIDAAISSNAEIIVLCSSDTEYVEMVPSVCEELTSENRSIIIAGYPKDNIKRFEQAGIDEFIHMKSNTLEILKKYSDKYLSSNGGV